MANDVVVEVGPVSRLRRHGRPTGWEPIEQELMEGKQPQKRFIAVELRAGNAPRMPQVVANYLADILDGKVKLRPGAKPKDPRDNALMWIVCEALVRGKWQEFKERGERDPLTAARDEVAREQGIPAGTIAKHIGPMTVRKKPK